MPDTYNAIVELDEPHDEHRAEQLVDGLVDYHVAVGRSLQGRLEATITLPAEGLRQAVTTALHVVAAAAGAPPRAIEVLPTGDFDARHGLAPVPEQLSVPEVAAELGTSRQAVLQRIEAGTLPATKVGRTWVVPRAAVERIRARAER